MIDFPASPVLNQTFTAPSGVMYKCTSADPVVWTSMATQTSVPEAPIDGLYYARKDAAWAENAPFIEAPTDNLYYTRRNATWTPVTKAGAGLDQVDNTSDANKPVSTAQANADNLRVLKTGDTMTGPLKLPDGTVAAPALAFGSEAGLGVYRIGASAIGWAAQGADLFRWSTSNAAAAYFGMFPRAAGTSTINLYNAPATSANYNAMTAGVLANGDGQIANAAGGTGTPNSSLQFQGYANLVVTSATDAAVHIRKSASAKQSAIYGGIGASARWSVVLGDAQAETGGNAGSAFAVNRFGDNGVSIDSPLVINRNNGYVVTPNGIAPFGSDWNVRGFWETSGGANRYMSFGTGGSWTWRWDGGPLYWFAASASTPTFALLMNGTARAYGNFVAQLTSAVGPDGRQFTCYAYEDGNKPCNFYCTQDATGVNAIVNPNDGGTHQYFQFYTTGNARAPGAWQDGSDGRVKINRAVIDNPMMKVLALTGYTYERSDLHASDGSNIRAAGLIAQDVKSVLPDAVSCYESSGLADFHYLDYNAVTALLVNAVKEINNRLTALETK